MTRKFEPIKDKCGEIIEYIMQSPHIPTDETIAFRIRLAVEEVVQNVVDYAYPDGDGWIEASTQQTEDENQKTTLIITIKDEGVQFDPLAKDDPDVTLSAEERQIGGLGIFLCKQLMDEVTYKFEDNCNVLTLVKSF